MILKVQRFQRGHQYYTDKITVYNGAIYQCVFGQLVDENNKFICYTMERKMTLIEIGIYEYDFYNSPANKAIVPILTKHNGIDISARKIEIHIANFPYELKGCTAVGVGINLTKPMLISSGVAFKNLMTLIGNEKGTFIYENLEQNQLA